ncbi:group II intron maturase-specific domain-containing protein [Endozoicomonas euniceicola]|uniref:Group II intron maturase-specific domain-containing protein n=1 Tax=Endozoicomonas euniceicola TaxID=1234143 RepID=A0ABY6GX48_9GAMM|nr:group II intron maturase-specific domain-containing protein [Endozoicomonas euniceicola]UYM17354.1 hypothetical protein NX720_05385 [Endozoicomonas euniceicola]
MASITRYLERRLKLRVNPTKSKAVKATEAEFLSFTFTGKRIRWSEKSLNRFKRKILKLTGRSWGVSMEYRLKKLAEYIRGWMGYFRDSWPGREYRIDYDNSDYRVVCQRCL